MSTVSTGYTGKTTTRKSEDVAQQATSEREATFGEMPGEVVDFNPELQTASIQPLYQPRHNGVNIKMPVLLDVPVRYDHCTHGGLTYPLVPGDIVNLRPQMRSMENYHTTGEHVASDTRSYALSDYEAYIDGGNPLTEPIKNFDPDNLDLRFDELGIFGLHASKTGKINLDMAGGELLAILIAAFTALSVEPELASRPAYAAAAAALTASRLP